MDPAHRMAHDHDHCMHIKRESVGLNCDAHRECGPIRPMDTAAGLKIQTIIPCLISVKKNRLNALIERGMEY